MLMLSLHAPIKADESTWTLDTNQEFGSHISFCLEKQVEGQWPALEASKN